MVSFRECACPYWTIWSCLGRTCSFLGWILEVLSFCPYHCLCLVVLPSVRGYCRFLGPVPPLLIIIFSSGSNLSPLESFDLNYCCLWVIRLSFEIYFEMVWVLECRKLRLMKFKVQVVWRWERLALDLCWYFDFTAIVVIIYFDFTAIVVILYSFAFFFDLFDSWSGPGQHFWNCQGGLWKIHAVSFAEPLFFILSYIWTFMTSGQTPRLIYRILKRFL